MNRADLPSRTCAHSVLRASRSRARRTVFRADTASVAGRMQQKLPPGSFPEGSP